MNFLELNMRWIYRASVVLALLQLILAAFYRKFVPWTFWPAFGFEAIIISSFGILTKRRDSLRWQAEQLIRRAGARRETSRSINLVNRRFQIAHQFGRLGLLFMSVAFSIYVVSDRAFHFLTLDAVHSFIPKHYSASFLQSAWQVQATLIGFIIAILALLFQFISDRVAFESSVLPVLAREAWLTPIIVFNLLLILISGFFAQFEDNAAAAAAVLISVVASVLTTLYLTVFIVRLLDPNRMRTTLLNKARSEMLASIRDDRINAAAAYLLELECNSMRAYLDFYTDFYDQFSPVMSQKEGLIEDIDLALLRQVANGVSGEITLPHTATKARLLVLKSIGSFVYRHSALLRFNNLADAETWGPIANVAFRVGRQK